MEPSIITLKMAVVLSKTRMEILKRVVGNTMKSKDCSRLLILMVMNPASTTSMDVEKAKELCMAVNVLNVQLQMIRKLVCVKYNHQSI